jgi:hypothetical protein
MAHPARRVAPAPEDPPVDPTVVDRAYLYHRARRRARLEHKREQGRARLRFLVVLLVLVGLAVFLVLTTWHEIQSIFGL